MKLTNCNNGEFIFYQVQKDENLNSILQKFSTTSSSIIRNNPNIDFYTGEIIKIMRSTYIQHIVKPMETLATIAQKYNTNIDALIKQNNLASKRLFVGQTLIINSNKN